MKEKKDVSVLDNIDINNELDMNGDGMPDALSDKDREIEQLRDDLAKKDAELEAAKAA